MALRSPCEGISRVEIFECDYIAARAADMPFDRIERHTMAGVLCLKILWFSQNFLPVHNLYLPEVGYLPRSSPQAAHILDEPADGLRLWALQISFFAKSSEQRIDLFLPEVWMLHRRRLIS